MIRRLLVLSGIAIVGAVIYHGTGWSYTAMFWWAHRYMPVTSPNFDQLGSLSYYGLRAIEQFVSFGVAAFLFVSGSFIAIATGRSQKTVGWKITFSRINSLLIPYLIWSLFLFALDAAEGKVQTPVGYLTALLLGGTTPHYYFVPLLIQLYLLAPVLVRLAKWRWKWLLIGAAMLQLLVLLLTNLRTLGLLPDPSQPLRLLSRSWFFPGNIFWFALGIVMGQNLQSAKVWLYRVRWRLLALAIVLFPLCIVEWEWILGISNERWIAPQATLLDFFYAGSVTLSFLAFTDVKIPLSNELDSVAARTFGIYLVHSPVLMILSRLIYAFAPWLLAFPLLFLVLISAFGVGVPMALMRLVSHEQFPMRQSYRLLFG